MTLNTTRSKVPHICVTSVSKSQISVRFPLKPAISAVTGHSETSALNDSKWPWTQQGQRYHILLMPQSPKCHPFHSTTNRFWVTKLSIIGRKCTEWPQIDLEYLTVKSAPYTLGDYLRGPNLGPFLSTINRFQDCWKSEISEMYRIISDWLWNV